MPNIHALTRSHTTIVRQIVSDVTLRNIETGEFVKTLAIWDTGATGCVVSEDIANKLNLTPIGFQKVNGISGERTSKEYYLNITLNNEQITLNTSVTDCNSLSPDGSIGMLVGMDIISRGDFCITNHQGRTIMTFRIPSIGHVDYCAELRESAKYRKMYAERIKHGNDKCPCGSGKKYKNCHGKS